MPHTKDERTRLLHRIRRILGQMTAIEGALDRGADCSEVLHSIASCRGALDGLMAEVIEGHIRFHVLPQRGRTSEQERAADDLISSLRAYLS